ncbi:hypothetical protein GGR42_002586 [Saonia flava]|uniref:2TM domain-containing protein n=1 Tax=Saonia flava TaxID=523696 RepID=A0A846R2C8_9FLAO|nr:2TM domain-containing protein [Saonia flava]NJB72095.1 hypothetical protein [Saonia flava]
MERDYFEEESYLRAQKRVKELKGFYWHLFWYMAVNIFILIMIYRGLGKNDSFFRYEHFATAFFWGIGILGHWFGVFGIKGVFSKNWEKRKIKEYMDKDKF